MMKMKTYSCQSGHTYLTLLVFAAVIVYGHAQYDGDITLDDDGLVAVYTEGKWSVVCVSENFTVQSQVLCRSFGQKFSNYSSRRSYLGGAIRDLQCRGDENSLSACSNYYSSSYGCSYKKLHVQCQEDSTTAFCPFDNDMCGMDSEGTTGYKWQRFHPDKSSGLSGQSVPKNDHTTESNKGKYMLASAVSLPGVKAILKTKPFVGNIKRVSFYYHMFGRDMGSLNVYIKTNNSSRNSIGSISGNQGIGWKYLCISVDEGYGHHEIIFEAVQGNGFDGDIAIDDMTISETNCSSQWNGSCGFESSTCGYDIQNSNNIYTGWRLQINNTKKIYSNSGNYLKFTTHYSSLRHSVTSPIIDIPKEKSKVEFRYYMPGTGFKELQVRFVEEGLKSWFTKTPYFWQDNEDHGSEWQYGCMELPTSKRGEIKFTAIANTYSAIGLDDLVVDKGYCRTGITNHMCTFDNPLLCEYKINCMNPNEYTWRRKKGKTPSSGTGPETDYSGKRSGYYMYAEASYGTPNTTAELRFLVSNVKGKNLKFGYNMFGSGVGQLYVLFNSNNQFTKLSSKKQIVWAMKGDRGPNWHEACLHIENDVNEIIFVAVRGFSYQGDIAVDNILIEEKICPGPFDCDFQNSTCNYTVSHSLLSWHVANENRIPNDSNRYLYIYPNTNTENAKFEMKSPQANMKGNSSVTFRYQLRGNMKDISLITYDSYSRNKSWSSNYKNYEFMTACVDFPLSTKFGLIFQATTNADPQYKSDLYLDDIDTHNETCKLGLTYHFCKFKEIHLCNFHVECPEHTKYNWSRGSPSDKHVIPRQQHYSYVKEYFMYVNSSNGRTGDKTHLSFPNVVPPKGHNLRFDYYLQHGSGKLQLHLETSKGNKLVFEVFSVIKSTVWHSVCIDIKNNTNTTIVFTATRVYASYGLIGLANVGFKPEACQARSISCDFSEGTCQYNNLNPYSTWKRITSRNDTYQTNGFYMETTFSSNTESILVSPNENITNSCIQIRYKIISKNCNLTIFNAFNNDTILSPASDDTTQWRVAQKHIQQEAIQLVFRAKKIHPKICVVLLDYINITENNCPQLECPAGTRKCKNNYCYSESKVCDRINDCSDGTDEMNCSTSIACDFKSKYYCGYRIVNGWQHVSNKYASPFNVPGSMQIIGTKGKMISPFETLADSCVKFQYVSDSSLNGNFSVILNHWNATAGILHRQIWNELFVNHKYGSYEGQLQFPAGKGFLQFTADVVSAGLAINNVAVFKGTCPELHCSKNSFKCLDNSKCVDKKNVCNNYWNCMDGSDEKNCSKYFSCDFEDTNMCGFKSYPEKYWFLHTGFSGERPKLDHSERKFSGHYVMSNSTEETYLVFPKLTNEDTFCLNFYYTFYGNGTVSIYDNDTFLMSLSKFDYDMWRSVNITLPSGSHNIRFTYPNGKNISGAVALDSVSILPGRCLLKGCGEKWYPCHNESTCYPFTAKCDGIMNCPNGEDEHDCNGNQWKYKLVGGRSLLSGIVKKRYGSRYMPVCATVYKNAGLKDICSEFGANVTVTYQIDNVYMRGFYYSCYSEPNFPCTRRGCTKRCKCTSLYLTCSDTVCEDGEVKCPLIHNGSTYKDVCIRRDSLCDGEIDCEGGTDEENCVQCEEQQWQCKNKKCIQKSLRCDGREDCDDGSDEFHCFRYINETIQVYYNGSYKYICEDNLKNNFDAEPLCFSVGRGYDTLDNPVPEYGVLFTFNTLSSDTGLIPGFKPNSFVKCNVIAVKCAEETCGTRKIELFEPNIKNGHNALEGKWPWAVQVYRERRFICTGILISNTMILCAAHCFTSENDYTYYIRVGTTKRFQGTEYRVNRILKHENYTNYKTGYDIAILYVNSEIKMSPYVQPVCLPEGPVPRDRDCYITGWGKNESLEFPKILQEAKVYMIDNILCKKHFSFFKNITICVNNKEDTQPACHGDSGGPLLCRDRHGKWVAYGVTSYGKPACAGPKSSPAVYTDIYTFIPWIFRNG